MNIYIYAVTGASRGYAFVEFETEREMRRAYKVPSLCITFQYVACMCSLTSLFACMESNNTSWPCLPSVLGFVFTDE